MGFSQNFVVIDHDYRNSKNMTHNDNRHYRNESWS